MTEKRKRYSRWLNVLLLAAGVAGAAVLFRASESIFHRLNVRMMNRTSFEGEYWNIFEYDPDLGTHPVPDAERHIVKKVDDKVIYDVVYRTDGQGRRITPQPEGDEEPGAFMLFFGGSYTFGEGLPQDETLPAHAVRMAPGFRAYNYGSAGYGPQQMLARLERGGLGDEVAEPSGIAVYCFTSLHIRRAIGSMRVASSWGANFPYYAWDGEQLVRHESFSAGRPRLDKVYRFLGKSDTLWYLDVDWPLTLRPRHLEHTCQIAAAARDAFLEQYPDGRFCVLLYPDYPRAEVSSKALCPFLERLGIEYIDATGAADMSRPGYSIPEDGHPTGATNEAVAAVLVHALSLDATPSAAADVGGGPANVLE